MKEIIEEPLNVGSGSLARRLMTIILLAIVILPMVSTSTTEAAKKLNHRLPNNCRIDASNWNSSQVANARTHEDDSCVKINVRTRYFDINSENWRTADYGYVSTENTYAPGGSYFDPQWSDHNGLNAGSYWGFRLQG